MSLDPEKYVIGPGGTRKSHKDSKKGVSASQKLAYHVSEILRLLGEDVHREGLVQTPKRYSKAMEFFTSGYQKNVDQLVGDALFSEASSEIIVVRDIELFSLCEHHLLPFYGKAHI